MKNLLTILWLLPVLVCAQTNLVDYSTWTEGQGSAVSIFTPYGTWSNNIRETDLGPHGTSTIIWKGLSNSTSDNEAGWNTDYVPIDPSKTYRLTVWIKRTGSLEGKTNFGFKALDANDTEATRYMNGTVKNNPYFEWNPPPTLNDWYLLVAFVYGHDYSGGTNDLEGIYNTSGTRVDASLESFKFGSTAIKLRHRVYLRITEPPTAQWFYGPTVYEVNGQEPTIQELIEGPDTTDTQAPTAPTLSSIEQSDTTADLSWSGATDNVGVTGYTLFQDNVQVQANIPGTSYQVTGLTASTTYNFKVRAYDAAGNQSPDSNTLPITTDADPGNGGGNPGTSVWTESNAIASYSGKVQVGNVTVPADYAMAIDGKLITEEVRVELSGTWPDYVFSQDYDLPALEDIQKHIEEKGHLPNIPSAREVAEGGIALGEMDRLLLEKIEEQMLYILQLKRETEMLKTEIKKLKSK